MDDKLRQKFMDFGALGFTEQRIRRTLGITIKRFNELKKLGAMDAYAEGASTFSFDVLQALMEKARGGCIDSITELNRIQTRGAWSPAVKRQSKPPSKFSDSIVALGRAYVASMESKEGGVPTVQGLCRAMNIGTSTLDEWRKEPEKWAIADLHARVMSAQHDRLVEGGLTKVFDAQITKLMLMKHGYNDRVDQTSSDGSMTPKAGQTIQVTIGGKRLDGDE